jgi:hypothetical protein
VVSPNFGICDTTQKKISEIFSEIFKKEFQIVTFLESLQDV